MTLLSPPAVLAVVILIDVKLGALAQIAYSVIAEVPPGEYGQVEITLPLEVVDHPANEYPDLVGSAGFVTVPPYVKLPLVTAEPSCESKTTV